ncbi:hypothetical protein [Sphingomonas pruni]|uniref:hypothetical protein n=1 Tax=Sphingomonas pruni TaxID=40683 RepID=UPI0012EDDB06|nr:hypothetical protein [Sphingomonas pruni]
MNTDMGDTEPDNGSATWVGILFLGLGLLFGWGFGGDRKEKAALDWAVKTTRGCEQSYRTKGYPNVADCLQGAIEEIDDERAVEARSDGGDPR